MDQGLYVSLSSQIALERRLQTIAHNVANIGTTGFRAGVVRFQEVLEGVKTADTSFVSQGESFLSPNAGGLTETGGKLDFAIQGDAWFSVQTPAGQVVTKDGRFKMLESGDLVSMDGHPVLDPGGAPIQLNPAAGPPQATASGQLRQNGATVGAVGLFSYQPGADFERYGNSGIVAATAPEPLVDNSDVGVIQGHLEQSNVNAVGEMARLINVHRSFDNVATSIRETESSLKEAIRVLGARS